MNFEMILDLMKAWNAKYPYDFNSALKLTKSPEECDVKFLEEPLPPY